MLTRAALVEERTVSAFVRESTLSRARRILRRAPQETRCAEEPRNWAGR